MKVATVRALVGCLLLVMPVVGAVGLRRGGHLMHTSLTRTGGPTAVVTLLMGPRDELSETRLQQMQPMDQYWFAFENTDEDKLQRIAVAMTDGDHRLGPRTVVCMTKRPGMSLEQARADDVHVCVGGFGDDVGVPHCQPQDWIDQGGRLVLMSLVGQHARLERRQLVQSCQNNARHWRQWHQRQ